jgi:hypothetical protein
MQDTPKNKLEKGPKINNTYDILSLKPDELYHFWVTRSLENSSIRLDGVLQEGAHSKFKSVCSLRFIQLLHRKTDSSNKRHKF